MTPFLKWAGGKRQLLPELRATMPPTFGRYYEPFVGAGALFFDLRPSEATIGDANERLVRTYRAIRDDVEAVVDLLKTYPHDRDFYLEIRAVDVDACPDVEVAAWMLYLNRTAFNGLYRVNASGRFNVPFGKYASPTICDADNLRACAAALAGVDIVHGDFEATVAEAEPGDFVYFDPPYVPLSATSSFTNYTADGFNAADQARLRDVAARLKARGVHILLSNSSAGAVRELYGDGFAVREVAARRAINSRADRRGPVHELLIA